MRLFVIDLGTMPYEEALELQRAAARLRIAGEIDEDLLLLVEHPPVITFGRSGKPQHLLAAPELLRQRGVALFEVERGGDVTFHGPGQLVGYPIVDLKRHRRDLHWYLRQMEQALIDALVAVGVAGDRNPPHTGVWVDGRKIASIGVHARDWVTWHGFALNVTTDLGYFDLIVPCGIPEVTMTSLERERAGGVTIDEVKHATATAFGRTFGLFPEALDAAYLTRRLPRDSSAVQGEPVDAHNPSR
jgi:lipoyl(octanoyl) transferase